MKKFIQEFSDFIKRGNALDLAVGLVIGTAFNAIVKSMVNDLIMPLLGLVIGDNFSLLKIVLVQEVIDPATQAILVNEVAIRYGAFIQTIVDFLLIGLSIFVALKIITATRKRLEAAKEKLVKKFENEEDGAEVLEEENKALEEEAALKPSTEELLSEIRDLLKERKTE